MPGPVSDSYQGPIDPIVQRIYDAIRALDVDQATPAEDVIDAIELAFEAHGTPTNVLRCAFCGQEYPAGTPSTKHAILTEHIMQCQAHPLRGVIESRDNLARQVAGWEAQYAKASAANLSLCANNQNLRQHLGTVIEAAKGIIYPPRNRSEADAKDNLNSAVRTAETYMLGTNEAKG